MKEKLRWFHVFPALWFLIAELKNIVFYEACFSLCTTVNDTVVVLMLTTCFSAALNGKFNWIHKWTICLPMTLCASLQRGPNCIRMCQHFFKVSLRNVFCNLQLFSEAINNPEWRLLCLTPTIIRETAHFKQQRWVFYIVTRANRSGTRGS